MNGNMTWTRFVFFGLVAWGVPGCLLVLSKSLDDKPLTSPSTETRLLECIVDREMLRTQLGAVPDAGQPDGR